MTTTNRSTDKHLTTDLERCLDDAYLAAFTLRRVASTSDAFTTLADQADKAAAWLSNEHRRCEWCVHYSGGACGLAPDVAGIPAEVLPVGCGRFEYQYIPF